MVRKFFLTALAVLVLAACAKTEISSLSTSANLIRRVLTASVDSEEQEAVKTTLSDHKISWSAGDKIGVLGSDGNQYEFTTETGGSENVEFVGEMPDNVEMWYSYYPYNESATVSWSQDDPTKDRTVYTSIPVFQDGKFGNGLIMAANSRIQGKNGFQFTIHSSGWRLNVPEAWNVEELIMIGDEGDNHQPLAGDGYRLNFYGTVNDKKKERCASAGAMEYMVSVSNPDGGTLSGETYIFTRHCPATAVPKYTLVLRTSDKKVAFLRFDGSKDQTVTSGKIYDIKLPPSISKWYDCVVATIDFADGGKQWWNFSSPKTDLLDGGSGDDVRKWLLSNRPFDYEFSSGKGGDYFFRVYSPLYSARSQYHGLRTGCTGSENPYYEFPTLKDMAPAIVDVRFGSTSKNFFQNGKSCIVYEEGGTEKSLLDTLPRTGSTAMEANIRTKVWNFITANPTTVKGRTYRMKATGVAGDEIALRSLRVIYAGTEGPRAENILTKDAAVYYEGTAGTKAVTLNGAFRMHGSGDFVCGFEYKLDDGSDSWHDLPCETATETFSVRTTVFENGKRYIYRAYAGLSGGTRFYGIERPVMFFAMDLADSDEYTSYFGNTSQIKLFPVNVNFGDYILSLGYGGTTGSISFNSTNGFVMSVGDYPYYQLPAVPGMRITGIYVWSVTSGSRAYLLNTKKPSDNGAAIGTTVMEPWTAVTQKLSSNNLSIAGSNGVSYYMINGQTKSNAQYLHLLAFRYE